MEMDVLRPVRSCLAVVGLGVAALSCSSLAAAQTTCAGDCDNNSFVRVNELITGVNIALDREELSACPSFDLNDSLHVEVNELVTAVNNALHRCPEAGSPTPTITERATPSVTNTSTLAATVTPTFTIMVGAATPTGTVAEAPTPSPTLTVIVGTASPTGTVEEATATPTFTVGVGTASPTGTVIEGTPTHTATPPPTGTATSTPTATATPTPTGTQQIDMVVDVSAVVDSARISSCTFARVMDRSGHPLRGLTATSDDGEVSGLGISAALDVPPLACI